MAIDYAQYQAVPVDTPDVKTNNSNVKSTIDYSKYNATPYKEATINTNKQPETPAVENRSLLDKAANNPVTSGIISAGSGLQQGLFDVIGNAAEFASEILGSKETQDRVSRGVKYAESKLSSNNPMFQNDIQDNLALNSVGRATGNVGGMLSTGLLGESLPAVVASNAFLGGAMAGKDNRLQGAAAGAVLPLVASKIGASAGNFVTSNARLPNEIQLGTKKVNTANLKDYQGMNIEDATNTAFNKFRAVSGKIDTTSLKDAVAQTINNESIRLTPRQMGLLEDVNDQLSKAQNLADLHDIRKFVNTNFNKAFFKTGDEVVGRTRTAIMDIKAAMENTMDTNAKQLGVLDQYKEANFLHKQSLDADKLNEAVKAMDAADGGISLNKFNGYLLKPKIRGTLQPETQQVVDGIRKTTYEANHLFGVNLKDQVMGQLVIRGIQAMTQTPGLNQLLQMAGSPTGKAIAKRIAQAIVNRAQAEYIKQANDQTEQ